MDFTAPPPGGGGRKERLHLCVRFLFTVAAVAPRPRRGICFQKLCAELKFSGSRYVLGPTGFLWHVRRFASASYGGHLSEPKWLPLKACPHVRTRRTHPTKAEREREKLCLCV
jgi:hypothetical protein